MFTVASKEHQKWVVKTLQCNTTIVLTREINGMILKKVKGKNGNKYVS